MLDVVLVIPNFFQTSCVLFFERILMTAGNFYVYISNDAFAARCVCACVGVYVCVNEPSAIYDATDTVMNLAGTREKKRNTHLNTSACAMLRLPDD